MQLVPLSHHLIHFSQHFLKLRKVQTVQQHRGHNHRPQCCRLIESTDNLEDGGLVMTIPRSCRVSTESGLDKCSIRKRQPYRPKPVVVQTVDSNRIRPMFPLPTSRSGHLCLCLCLCLEQLSSTSLFATPCLTGCSTTNVL